MSSKITTEDGNRIVQETVSGIAYASSLNDTNVETIFSDHFDVDPLTNGWLIGDDWEWDASNKNMKMAP